MSLFLLSWRANGPYIRSNAFVKLLFYWTFNFLFQLVFCHCERHIAESLFILIFQVVGQNHLLPRFFLSIWEIFCRAFVSFKCSGGGAKLPFLPNIYLVHILIFKGMVGINDHIHFKIQNLIIMAIIFNLLGSFHLGLYFGIMK